MVRLLCCVFLQDLHEHKPQLLFAQYYFLAQYEHRPQQLYPHEHMAQQLYPHEHKEQQQGCLHPEEQEQQEQQQLLPGKSKIINQ